MQQLQGKTLNQMAAISSTAACAPVTAHTKGNNKKYNIQYLLCYISRKNNPFVIEFSIQFTIFSDLYFPPLGSIPNINNIAEISPSNMVHGGVGAMGAETTTNVRSSFVDKLHHGITDKLHSLSGHLTHDASKTGKKRFLTKAKNKKVEHYQLAFKKD